MLSSKLLHGDHIRLTAVTSSDLSTLVRWWQDPGFLRLYDTDPAYPKTEDQLARRVEEGQTGKQNFLFGIRRIEGDELIGLFELDGVQWPHRTSWLSIGIGDEASRGQGYGYEAMQLGLDFAFYELNLYRVVLSVFSYNEAALALYGRLGFTREGVLREHFERDGRRHDMIIFGLLRDEWRRRQQTSPTHP